MKAQFMAALVASAALAACGGGSSTVAPIGSPPTATPTVAPAARHIVFSWSGAAHSRGGSSAHRSVLDTITGTEPIEVGAPTSSDPNDAATRTGESQAVVRAQEVDTAGSPVPSAAPSYVVTNTAIASTAAIPQPSGTPLAQVIAMAPGTTTTVVSFPDGTTGTVPVASYQTIHPSCPAKQAPSLPANADGYRYDSGTHSIVPAADPASADLFFTGPNCDGLFRDAATTTTLHMPAGYTTLPDSTPLGTVLSVGTFTPAGTTLDLANGQTFPAFLVVKTATAGVFIKWRVTSFGGAANGGEVDGDALASDVSMAFAF